MMERIINESNEFVVLDIETSHFHPSKGAMIIEVAAVKIRDGKIVDKRTQLINPERKITAKITEITGITNEMLVGKPVYRQVLPKILDFIGDAVVVGHNVKFDWDTFLIHFFNKLGLFPENKTVDTLKLSRKYIKSDNYKLATVCDVLGITHDNQHRALGDTEVTAEVFLHLKKIIDENAKKDVTQLTLTEIVPNENETPLRVVNSQEVRDVKYWRKEINKNILKRLYVTLDRSVVFFDIPTNSWEAKSTNEAIDFKEIERGVIDYLNVDTFQEAINRYN